MNARPTDEQLAAALRATLGQPARVAESLGCSLEWIYRRARASRRVRNALGHCRGKLLDLAESALWKLCLEGEPWAVRLVFELWGRSRNYTDGGELWHAPGATTAEFSPEQVLQVSEELLKHAEFTESVRRGAEAAHAGGVRPPRERRALVDGATSGEDRPGDRGHD